MHTIWSIKCLYAQYAQYIVHPDFKLQESKQKGSARIESSG